MSDEDWLQETAVQDLSAFHDVPWTMLEGMHAKFRITTDPRTWTPHIQCRSTFSKAPPNWQDL